MNRPALPCRLLFALISGVAIGPASSFADDRGRQVPAASTDEAHGSLDGLSVDGRIRARGIIGLFSVPGTLSFEDGDLFWATRGEVDSGPYSTRPGTGVIEFHAEHMTPEGDIVVWSGRYADGRFHDVTAVWTRVAGDAVHDLFLPDDVVLNFTPADGRQ
ncbi:hypothetical protein [Hyphobacterium marinum]|uniref:Uncharacterized protein n=1 Tax=Hyphobacterium marinum TaxID=3116574 RepID=A0ABU7LUR8_9PROT|nr:hypothetical protein [Hyphobacterium sp. Y6023]MEE2565231.1 hypothetical protein [Hyphobacterium sp. Y6023]